jgi:hypothetical protein
VRKNSILLLNSKFRRVLNAVFFLSGESPASRFYMPTFRNTQFRLHSWCKLTPPMKMELSVSKRRHIKSRGRGFTQKKEYINRSKFFRQQMHSLLKYKTLQLTLKIFLCRLLHVSVRSEHYQGVYAGTSLKLQYLWNYY